MSQTIGCGDMTWPNIDSLIHEAAQSKQNLEDALQFRRIVLAICLAHPGIRVSAATIEAVSGNAGDYTLEVGKDHASDEIILRAVRAR